jgi:hypothetical protein
VSLDCTGLDVDSAGAALEAALAGPGDRHRTLVRLRLTGLASLATRSALDVALERLSGEFLWLDVVEDGLAAEPDAADLAALEAMPATAAAARALQAAAASGSAEERDAARLALRLLFGEARALERRA